jgi:peptidoglycan/xylan/chitin deacetylase (PgdA/CDA1 family)
MVIIPSEKQHIPILMYHSISSYASTGFRPCIVSPEAFDKHLSYLEQCHYTSVTVTQLVRAMATSVSTLPPRPVVLTFDDGYADFYTAALPALQRHGFIATLYIATAFVEGTSRWLQYIGEGDRPMLTWEQLAEINASGIECAAHTHTHPALDMLSPSAARDEIVRSKELLEEHLSQHVSSFAYPFGYYSPRVLHIVRESGFDSACAIGRKMSSMHDNPYALARLAIWPDTNVHMLATALSIGRGPLVASPIRRARLRLRLRLRSAYGRLLCGWNAA